MAMEEIMAMPSENAIGSSIFSSLFPLFSVY